MDRNSSAQAVLHSVEFQLSLLNLTSVGTEPHPQVQELWRLRNTSEAILLARN
jgi:hypothetical protein